MADSKKAHFSKSPILKIFSQKFLRLVLGLKWVKTNLTFSWHSGFEGHKFLHFLSHFGKKEIKNIMPRPGFKLTKIRLEAHGANYYTTDAR